MTLLKVVLADESPRRGRQILDFIVSGQLEPLSPTRFVLWQVEENQLSERGRLVEAPLEEATGHSFLFGNSTGF